VTYGFATDKRLWGVIECPGVTIEQPFSAYSNGATKQNVGDNWFLVENTISKNYSKAIQKARDIYGEDWISLKKQGFFAVRLDLTDDLRPFNISFGSKEPVICSGIADYMTPGEGWRQRSLADAKTNT
jgi:hypothetical protein